ncbi:PrpF domain-containing protein [Actinokineospora bangkokensis]|uniref:Methylitaconate delta2-delta3-isomerase n=1 Tax=Actinokineospora bangkokensis TaxID=1193682 RepID=A0A1Q9LIJ5_9PSEU|nr:PrpF domain-containing protein [Actinokineospora bangkokensis]OLR91830.1 methylitaconate delta2-delta3-isomerase [Actinokineospora bangkokensis]
MREIPATWMRGGTSKCWVFDREALAVPGRSLDEVLLRLYGSPDPRQVDGVGGATSTTSKAVVLSPGQRRGVDVEYTFAQVGITDGRVDWTSNCGNCSAVIGPHALRRGWVRPTGDRTEVRVRNTNTDQLIVIEVPTPGGRLVEEGEDRDPGVAQPGLGVRLWFVDPAGRTTGALLPTGHAVDVLHGVRVSLVDAGAPVVVVPAPALGLTGLEAPADLDADTDLLDRLERLRRAAAVRMGLASTPEAAARATPKLALVGPGVPGRSDAAVRMLSMGRTHPALAITGSVALTLAAGNTGTVVSDYTGIPEEVLRLDTPAGVVTTHPGTRDGLPAVAVRRTTRRLGDATLALPEAQGTGSRTATAA